MPMLLGIRFVKRISSADFPSRKRVNRLGLLVFSLKCHGHVLMQPIP